MTAWQGLLVAAILVAAPIDLSAESALVYVDNAVGQDNHSGNLPVYEGSSNGPVRTLRAALKRVTPGGRIELVPTNVPYQEEVVIDGRQIRGYETAPLVINGNGVEMLGTEPTYPYEWANRQRGLHQLAGPFRSNGVLLFSGQPMERVAVATWAPSLPPLQPGQYALWQGAYFFQGIPGESIQPLTLAQSQRRGGLVIVRSNDIVIRNVRFRGYGLDGVQVRGPASGIRFEDCLFADNGRAGLSLYTNSEVVLSNCFVERNAEAGILNQNYSSLTLQSCQIAGSPSEILSDPTSKLTRGGPAPRPLPVGPVVPGAPAAPAPSADTATPPAKSAPQVPPSESKEETPKPAKKKGFFDD